MDFFKALNSFKDTASSSATSFSKKAKELGEGAVKGIKDAGEEVHKTVKGLFEWEKGSKPVLLIINAIPYTFPHAWVTESFNTSANFQYSTHPNDPIIFLPNDRTLNLSIVVPMGVPSTRTKYTIIKNAIRWTTWQFATTNTYVTPYGIKAASMLDMYSSYRFPFPTFRKKKKPINPRLEPQDKMEEYLNKCVEDKKLDWGTLTDTQKTEVSDCAKAMQTADKEKADLLAKTQAQEKCDEEDAWNKLTKVQKDKIIADKEIALKNQSIMNKIENAYNYGKKSHDSKPKITPKEWFKKMFSKNKEGIVPFTNLLKVPWQIQIAGAYWGRSTQIACCAVTGFSWESEPGSLDEVWSLQLLGYNFRKHTETCEEEEIYLEEPPIPALKSIHYESNSRYLHEDNEGGGQGKCTPTPNANIIPEAPESVIKDLEKKVEDQANEMNTGTGSNDVNSKLTGINVGTKLNGEGQCGIGIVKHALKFTKKVMTGHFSEAAIDGRVVLCRTKIETKRIARELQSKISRTAEHVAHKGKGV